VQKELQNEEWKRRRVAVGGFGSCGFLDLVSNSVSNFAPMLLLTVPNSTTRNQMQFLGQCNFISFGRFQQFLELPRTLYKLWKVSPTRALSFSLLKFQQGAVMLKFICCAVFFADFGRGKVSRICAEPTKLSDKLLLQFSAPTGLTKRTTENSSVPASGGKSALSAMVVVKVPSTSRVLFYPTPSTP
jgi:hypothetical protein